MKKILTYLMMTLSTITAFANDGIIANVKTSNVESFSKGGREATECIYEASFLEYPSGKKVLKINLGSDYNADIFFAFQLSGSTKLPLRDGFYYSQNSRELVTYKDGVLKYSKKEIDNLISSHYKEIELQVSSDLKTISNANAIDYTKGIAGRKRVARKIDCIF